MFKNELKEKHDTFKTRISKKNDYPENFIERCCNFFLNRIHIFKGKLPTIEKKTPAIIL